MLMWLKSGSCQNRLNGNAKAARFLAYLYNVASIERVVGTDLSRFEHHHHHHTGCFFLITCVLPGLVVTTLAPVQATSPSQPLITLNRFSRPSTDGLRAGKSMTIKKASVGAGLLVTRQGDAHVIRTKGGGRGRTGGDGVPGVPWGQADGSAALP